MALLHGRSFRLFPTQASTDITRYFLEVVTAEYDRPIRAHRDTNAWSD